MIRKYVRMAECLPTGYRFAWFDHRTHRGVCYPFGIHVLAWLAYRIWNASFFYLPEPEKEVLLARISCLEEDRRRLYREHDELRRECNASAALLRMLKTSPMGDK